jgi:peptidoglycan hydrolase CwlO-like protein
MAKQQLKDLGLLLTMLITICSCIFSVGYNYKTISDSEKRIAKIEEEKLDSDLYISKHEALKDNIGSQLNQNNTDHNEIKNNLQKLNTKVEDIQRKVDKLSKSDSDTTVIPTVFTRIN